MNDNHIKNNQTAQTAINGFIKKIQYRTAADALPTLSGVVSHIFIAAGQIYLLHLIKLRKYWLEQNDEFLARHAYPQNFSVVKGFSITAQYLKSLAQEPVLSPTILEKLKDLENSTVTKKQLFKQLRQRLKRNITVAEQEILLEPAVFTTKETLLHLVVYDGGFTQAIQFEMPTYLKKINQALSGFTVHRIECHVGDLGQKRQDQMWVGKLATNWELFIDPEFIDHCMPAFIQRFNYRDATLIIYVSEKTVKSQMKKPAATQKLLNQIDQSHPEFRYVIQKVEYLVQRNMNPEQTRAASLILGDSAYDPISSYDRFKQLIEQYTSKSAVPQREEDSIPSADGKPHARKLSHEDRVHEVENIFRRIKERSKSPASS